MPEFTGTDKALMLRSARLFDDCAKLEESTHGPDWNASTEARTARSRRDRLVRDARDMRALVRRLEAQQVPAVPQPKVGVGEQGVE